MKIEIKFFNMIVVIFLVAFFPYVLSFYAPVAVHTGASPENISYLLKDKSNLNVSLSTVNPGVKALIADSANGLVLKVQVNDNSGAGVSGAVIKLKAGVSETNGTLGSAGTNKDANPEGSLNNKGLKSVSSPLPLGSFHPAEGITDTHGSFITVYNPPASVTDNTVLGAANNTVQLTSLLSGTGKSSALQIKLLEVPVVLIHGYQASPDIFSGLTQFLKQQGFTPLLFKYASENGVAASSSELSSFLQKKTSEYQAAGIQINRFDLIGHSMGGLVARYYTAGNEYKALNNIRKVIYISVPQEGSPFASLGVQIYNNQGIKDLVPTSSLYTTVFPSMINKGLNPSIQTGSILGSYDEVVGTESASLADWGIDTEIFNLGESNFTIDKLLSGEILKAANHKMILYNKKVYQRVQEMLVSDIPYPETRNN